LPHGQGRLVVWDRVLPDESSAVRRRAALLTEWPARGDLLALERRAARGEQLLVVLDGLDDDLPADESAQRWAAAAHLVSAGATVVAGCAPAALDAARDVGARPSTLADSLPAVPVSEVVS
jgi:hypothetical protein